MMERVIIFLCLCGCGASTGNHPLKSMTPCVAQGSGATDLSATERALDERLMERSGKPVSMVARPVYEPNQEPTARTDAELIAAAQEPRTRDMPPCPRFGDSK